jgi:hypothetical protein
MHRDFPPSPCPSLAAFATSTKPEKDRGPPPVHGSAVSVVSAANARADVKQLQRPNDLPVRSALIAGQSKPPWGSIKSGHFQRVWGVKPLPDWGRVRVAGASAWVASLAFACLGAGVSRAPAAPPTGFRQLVLPILKQHCVICHNPQGVEVNLDLRSYRELMAGSLFGVAVIPGHRNRARWSWCLTRTVRRKCRQSDRRSRLRRSLSLAAGSKKVPRTTKEPIPVPRPMPWWS